MKASDFNRFARNPVNLDITRSRFDRSYSHKTTFNAGDLIPVYCEEVLPGDSFIVDTALVCRMSTPIHPTMDNAFLDIYYFFVPNRLTWEHWKNFMGESEIAFAPDVEYELPVFKVVSNTKGSIFDYFGIPIGNFKDNLEINALPVRAYALIWNEWFRDQNVFNPISIPLDDAAVTLNGTEGNQVDWYTAGFEDMVTDWYYGRPLPVAKYHDYFTSALPLPQKGPAVVLPLTDDLIPVGTSLGDGGASPNSSESLNKTPLYFSQLNGQVAYDGVLFQSSTGLRTDNNNVPSETGNFHAVPNNLYADTSGLSAISVNVLRQAFAMQRLFEKDARGGTRYTEIIRSHFGVTSPDARQQRPEYLGGRRIPITMQQVLQTSATNEVSPQGNAGANSLTQDKSSSFTYSATEHGYIIGLACVRTSHTYQQGVNRMWSRRRRYDFYDPVFANLGEQAILNKELFVSMQNENENKNEEVFGYQEAWAEYRYHPNTVSGAFRSAYAQSLDVWHYADNFASLPTLSPEFISETRTNIDRTLAVTSEVEDQFIIDFYFRNIAVRPMPLYSIPGLIDHH